MGGWKDKDLKSSYEGRDITTKPSKIDLFDNAQACCLGFKLLAQCAITNNRNPYIRLGLEQLFGCFKQIAVSLVASEMPYGTHNPCAHGKQWHYLLRIVETAQIDTAMDRLHTIGRDTTGNEHLAYSFGYSYVMYL